MESFQVTMKKDSKSNGKEMYLRKLENAAKPCGCLTVSKSWWWNVYLQLRYRYNWPLPKLSQKSKERIQDALTHQLFSIYIKMKTYETLALIVICDRLWLNVNTGRNVNTMVFPDFVTEYFYFIGEASLTTKRNKCERGKKKTQNVLSSTSVANGASWHLVCWVGVSRRGKLHGRSRPRKGSVTE